MRRDLFLTYLESVLFFLLVLLDRFKVSLGRLADNVL